MFVACISRSITWGNAPWNDEEMLAEVRDPCCQLCRNMVKWWLGLWTIGFPQARKTFRGSCQAVLRTSRQTGQLSGGREFIGEYVGCEPADRLAALFAGGVVSG